MSNETKWDVFGQLLSAYQNLLIKGIEIYDKNHCDAVYENITTPWNVVYDDALPDDLPVLPKEVGEYIKRQKDDLLTEQLFVIFLTIQHNINTDNPPDLKAENWIIDHSDTFASAWVLGVWRVEETGEIVKLIK